MAPSRRTALTVLAILAATFALYAPSLANGFAMDDRHVAKSTLDSGEPNELIAELQPASVYFSSHYWAASQPQRGDLYRPIAIGSYALVRALAVPDGASEWREAFPHHLINVLLHVACAGLAGLLVRRLTDSAAPALVAMFVFGVHAIHSEVVATVVGRAELFAFLFGGAAVLLATRSSTRSPLARAGRLLAAGVLFFLAFGSKESALAWIPFAGVYVAALRFAGRCERPGRVALEAVATGLVPCAVYLVLRHRALSTLPDPMEVAYLVNPLHGADTLTRLANATRVWGFGLLLTVFPLRLSADYGFATFDLVGPYGDALTWVSITALVGMLVAGLAGARRRPLVLLAVASFLGFSFTTSNVPLAIGTVFGERLYYAPSLGLSFFAAWIAVRTSRREGPRLVGVAALALWVGASALVVVQRNGVWRDDETLFLNEVRVQPNSVRMQMCAATVLGAQGHQSAAIAHLNEAVRLDPENALAWNNLAAIYLDLGRMVDAEYCVERGLLAAHVQLEEDGFKLYCNQGSILARTSREREAIVAFQRSIELNAEFHRARIEQLNLLAYHATVEEMESALAQAEAQAPELPPWTVYRGIVAYWKEDWNEAAAHLQFAFDHPPWPQRVDHHLPRFLLGDSLAQLDRTGEALPYLHHLARDMRAPESLRDRASTRLNELLHSSNAPSASRSDSTKRSDGKK